MNKASKFNEGEGTANQFTTYTERLAKLYESKEEEMKKKNERESEE
jgi:hypothetical protein